MVLIILLCPYSVYVDITLLLIGWDLLVCLICCTKNGTNPILVFLFFFPFGDALSIFPGGLQNAFCIQMSCPIMTTYFFGTKIWGWKILIHEGTVDGLTVFLLSAWNICIFFLFWCVFVHVLTIIFIDAQKFIVLKGINVN